ncbi:hypothetical protein [Micromonospora pisi]|nr:hypothetical protein [Micromonospora pisi]
MFQDDEIRRLARRRERYALAVLAGASDAPQLLADMREAGRQLGVLRDAEALAAHRNQGAVWAWPKHAPWAGF